MFRVVAVAAATAVTLSGCAMYHRMVERPVDWSGEVRGNWQQVATCASQRIGERLPHELAIDARTSTAVITSGMNEQVSLRQTGDSVRVEHRSPLVAPSKDNSIVWAAITGCGQGVVR